jgi:hypothetical protein
MAKKLIIIDRCYGCRHIGTIDCRNHYCRHPKIKTREIAINIFNDIPEWCPLPNAESENKNG